jgi:hypothetical protein
VSGAVPPVKRRDPWIDYRAEQAAIARAEAERRKDWHARTTWHIRHNARLAQDIEDEKRKALLGKGAHYF